MGSTLHNLLVHLVFSTKHRRAHITPQIQPRLYEYMGGIVRSMKGSLYEIGGMPDHVHLLVRWNTTTSVADLLREMKSSSSRWVHETFGDYQDFGWQDGYAAFSVSQSQVGRVSSYIQGQAVHHAKEGFQDELRRLLHAHEIEFDQRYIWD